MDFQWRYEAADSPEPPPPPRRRPIGGSLVWVILAVLATAIAAIGWLAAREARQGAETALARELQRVLDLEQKAVLAGDGELFLSLHVDDPAWIASQFLQHIQPFHRAARRVTRVTAAGSEAWANVSWSQGDRHWQRVVFFTDVDGEWHRTGASESFWGDQVRYRYAWGTVTGTEADEEWLDAIAYYIQNSGCCLDGALNLRLSPVDLAPRFDGDEFVAPSPRLVALDEAGRPGEPFWDMLGGVLDSTDRPLRFVVPDFWQRRYETLAATFAEDTGIQVEIVPQSTVPEYPDLWLPDVDGAFLVPTIGLITGGFVADLTDFAERDSSFAADDFFGQIWPAAWWQDRLWMVPAAANLPLLYYDRTAFEAAGIPELGFGSTWDDFAAAIARLHASDPSGDPYFGLVDTQLDTLWGAALNDEAGCPMPPCLTSVTVDDLARAKAWYEDVAADRMPNMAGLGPAERAHIGLQTGSGRASAVWVGHAADYEENLLLLEVGLAPFPVAVQANAGTAGQRVGITPIHVYGHVMSGTTTQPDRVWAWLRYLSFQLTVDRIRDVPARPSTAATSSYWTRLPGPIAEVMREAFPFARAIRLDESEWITWDRLAVLDRFLTPRTTWFTIQPSSEN